jgi:hypothetical protein
MDALPLPLDEACKVCFSLRPNQEGGFMARLNIDAITASAKLRTCIHCMVISHALEAFGAERGPMDRPPFRPVWEVEVYFRSIQPIFFRWIRRIIASLELYSVQGAFQQRVYLRYANHKLIIS